MQYEIFGGNLPVVTVKLEQGESMYTEAGGMAWMTDRIKMETNMKGGLMKGLGRMISGESMFMATYIAEAAGQYITFASSFPGSIIPLLLNGEEYICQRSAFLCAESGVTLETYVPKGLKAGVFGGEGLFMQKIKGGGLVFLEIDGSVVETDLASGERLVVSSGNVAAYESTVEYTAEMIKGVKNMVFGGEGLFLTTLTGPGKVYLQSITMPGFSQKLIPFLPFKKE